MVFLSSARSTLLPLYRSTSLVNGFSRRELSSSPIHLSRYMYQPSEKKIPLKRKTTLITGESQFQISLPKCFLVSATRERMKEGALLDKVESFDKECNGIIVDLLELLSKNKGRGEVAPEVCSKLNELTIQTKNLTNEAGYTLVWNQHLLSDQEWGKISRVALKRRKEFKKIVKQSLSLNVPIQKGTPLVEELLKLQCAIDSFAKSFKC